MTTDIRPEVVDGICDAVHRAASARLGGEPWEHLDREGRERCRTATRAEREQARAIMAADVADLMTAFDARWEGRADAIDSEALTLAAMAGVGDGEPGFPDDMATVYVLTARDPGPRRARAVADAIIRRWPADRRAEYERRTGRRLPADVPPPPAAG